MYNQFYGLTREPFAITPDPTVLYESAGHREALATILYGVETRKGFIVCTGEVGTGKTTVVRAFFDEVDPKKFKIVYLFTPQLTALQITKFICKELGMSRPSNRLTGVERLQLKLLEIYRQGQTVVLVIDEAQALPDETLEFLRLLSNFETDTQKLLQIVLVGQPELDLTLARRELRQVSQRVALYARLDPLSESDSVKYIRHRLAIAGAEKPQGVLSRRTIRMIARASGGIPRRINVLADNALIAGFGSEERPISARLARTTIREYGARSKPSRRDGSGFGPWRRGWPRIGAAAATMAASGAAVIAVLWQLGGFPTMSLRDALPWSDLLPSFGIAQLDSGRAEAFSPLPPPSNGTRPRALAATPVTDATRPARPAGSGL